MDNQILHICIDGDKEDVKEKVDCGFVYCPFCGERYLKIDLPKNEKSLEYFSKSGILPLIVSEKGIKNEPILNVTICGRLNYGKNKPLPDSLELIYKDKDGLEKRENYSI